MKKILFIVPLLLLLASCTQTPKIDVAPSTTSTNTKNTSVETSVVSKATPKENRTVPTPSYGSGKHTLEIFADFQCPACQNFSKTLEPIFKSYADKWQLVIQYRQFPLDMHKNAFRDAMIALCGAEQGKYMEAKTALYALETMKAGGKVSDTERIDTLTKAWLDKEKVSSCLASEAFKGQVDADLAYGEWLRVNGTPTLFLDGKKIDMSVFRDTEGFTTFLDTLLTK
jgi:protein-disulfide isomerase